MLIKGTKSARGRRFLDSEEWVLANMLSVHMDLETLVLQYDHQYLDEHFSITATSHTINSWTKPFRAYEPDRFSYPTTTTIYPKR